METHPAVRMSEANASYDVLMHPEIRLCISNAKIYMWTYFRGQLGGLAWDPREGLRPNDALLVKKMEAESRHTALSNELWKRKGEIPPELYPLVSQILKGYKEEVQCAQDDYWDAIPDVF